MTDYICKKDAKEKYTHLLSVAESLNTHVSPDFLDNIPPVTMFEICKECNSDSYDNGFIAGYEAAKNDLHDTSGDLISRKALKDIAYINKGNFNTVEGIREWIDNAQEEGEHHARNEHL